jgi:hypothetical protein
MHYYIKLQFKQSESLLIRDYLIQYSVKYLDKCLIFSKISENKFG